LLTFEGGSEAEETTMTRVPSRGGQRAPGGGPSGSPRLSRSEKAGFGAAFATWLAIIGYDTVSRPLRQALPCLVIVAAAVVVSVLGALVAFRLGSRE
jgi:hypothetical protein